MVNLKRSKEKRADQRGQSLVEVAVFGSFFLLVFGFLISQGLQYNYQQEVKMESFRRALQLAAASNVPKQQQVQVIKDVHSPDPSDMFALGDRNPVQAASGVLWSSNPEPLAYTSTATKPSTQYVFNPDSPTVSPFIRDWTIADLENYGGNIMVGRNSILNGIPDVYVVGSVAQTRVYQAEPGFGPKEVMVLMNTTIPNCEEAYCEKTILGEVEFPAGRGGLQYYPVYNVTSGEVGSPPGVIAFLNKDAGEINATLGAQQVVNKDVTKRRSLTLNEDANSYTSIEQLNDEEILDHVIMTVNGDQGPAFVFTNPEPSKTWTTQKN